MMVGKTWRRGTETLNKPLRLQVLLVERGRDSTAGGSFEDLHSHCVGIHPRRWKPAQDAIHQTRPTTMWIEASCRPPVLEEQVKILYNLSRRK